MANLDDKGHTKELVEQQQALTSYLDALFREMPAVEESESEQSASELQAIPAKPEVEAQESPALVEPPIQRAVPKAKPPVEKPLLPVAESPAVPQLLEQHLANQLTHARVQETTVEQPKPTQVVEPEPKSPAPTHYQPDSEFQVLFFRLGKLNLAVPLEHLAGILKIGEEVITKVPGYADWHMGLMKNQGVTVNVLDTAKLILPTHHQHVVEEPEPYRFYILLDGKRWGLACHGVAEVVTLQTDEVKWRDVRTLQPWLAGTVIEKMCALIDVEGFLKMLHEQHRSKKR